MRVYLLLLALILYIPLAKAQQDRNAAVTDSLIAALPAREDTVKAKMLYRIACNYINSDQDGAMKYMRLSLEIAQRLKWQYGIARGYGGLAVVYANRSDYPNALDNFFRSLKIFEQLHDTKETANILGNIANVYGLQSNHKRSTAYYLKALQLAEMTRDTFTIAVNLENIGAEHAVMKATDSALVYFNRALTLFEHINDRASTAGVFTRIATALQEQKDYSKALEYYFRSLKISEEEGHLQYIFLDLRGIGGAYFGIAADSTWKMKPDTYVMPTRRENLLMAIRYLERSLDSFRKYEFINDMSGNMNILSQAYEVAHRDRDALRLYKEYRLIQDSIFSTDSKLKIAELGIQREAELKDKQIELNQLEVRRRMNERIYFIAGLLLLFFGTGAAFRAFHAQRKVNRIQKDALAQKEILMKEIHHRVKNNLQVISMLLDLQLDNIDDERAQKAVTEGMSRIRSISLIHQQLYQSDDITSIEVSKFAADLLQQVGSVFKNQGQEVALVNEIQETHFDIDTAVPLGLILNELMTNSYKYAFGDGGNGTITIKMQKNENHYELRYRDSGPGLRQDVLSGKSKTLGMMVMKSLAKQLRGAFDYESSSKEFVIKFRDIIERKKLE